jgi:hypothetical protein
MTYKMELDEAILSVGSTLSEAGMFQDSNGERYLAAQIERVRTTFSGGIVELCIERFIDAELDFRTPGNRGLGRLSEVLPRYGAYFRRYLRSMPVDELAQVRNLIRNQVLTGYLAVALLNDDEQVAEPKVKRAEDVYISWVPKIYSGGCGESLLQAIYACGAHAKTHHEAFLARHRMKGGGIFSTDKTKGILLHYHLAGATLRLVEMA